MIAGLGVFREATDNILENVAHLHAVHMIGVQIQIRELFDHAVKTVTLVHLVNLGTEFQQFFQN